ncbi:MAG: hypothetical protein OEW86_11030 [Nitrosopumilus sp.]|nr:hypothetical protein [Nitrosopumilus sp.]MDH3515651.1 hypothetical protein [Nitrosopumilus sp.]MDH5418498.1 hypothetical protein [Nitrosopumilus sp.]MDH5554170.1 hypothetical protein [Nitrosopumilus sp.]
MTDGFSGAEIVAIAKSRTHCSEKIC